MGSSGTRVVDRVVWRTCDNCGHDGQVVEVIDPEAPYAGWECPTCKTEHETTDEVLFDGPDPDDARDRWLEDCFTD